MNIKLQIKDVIKHNRLSTISRCVLEKSKYFIQKYVLRWNIQWIDTNTYIAGLKIIISKKGVFE